jgi:hypothetical protein
MNSIILLTAMATTSGLFNVAGGASCASGQCPNAVAYRPAVTYAAPAPAAPVYYTAPAPAPAPVAAPAPARVTYAPAAPAVYAAPAAAPVPAPVYSQAPAARTYYYTSNAYAPLTAGCPGGTCPRR